MELDIQYPYRHRSHRHGRHVPNPWWWLSVSMCTFCPFCCSSSQFITLLAIICLVKKQFLLREAGSSMSDCSDCFLDINRSIINYFSHLAVGSASAFNDMLSQSSAAVTIPCRRRSLECCHGNELVQLWQWCKDTACSAWPVDTLAQVRWVTQMDRPTGRTCLVKTHPANFIHFRIAAVLPASSQSWMLLVETDV